MLEDVPKIFEAVFQCTLEVGVSTHDFFSVIFCVYLTALSINVQKVYCSEYWLTLYLLQMITKNFEDYPEHRLKFFSLLRAIATHCFPALIRLSSEVCIILVLDLLIMTPPVCCNLYCTFR